MNEKYLLQYKKDLPQVTYSDAMRTQNGEIWIAFERSGIGFIRSDSLFMYSRLSHFNTARSLLEVDNELWIGNFSGELTKFKNDSLFIVRTDFNTFNTNTLEKNSKGIWLTDYGTGVTLIKPNGNYTRNFSQTGLVGNGALDLHIDSYDNVWVADASKGISRIDENVFILMPNAEQYNNVD